MRALILLVVLNACGSGLSSQAQTNITNAAKTSAAAYRYQDAGSPAAALIRASHCSDQAALLDQNLPTVDSGIECK
jgi:hypothetical protein